jgi:hypothetical protein
MSALIELARHQILLRIVILREWRQTGIPWRRSLTGGFVRDEAGELTSDYFPRNQTDFCAWTAEKNMPQASDVNYAMNDVANALGVSQSDSEGWPINVCGTIKSLQPISRTTLSQPWHKVLKRLATRELDLVVDRWHYQTESANKTSIISALEAEVSHLRKVVSEQENETRASRIAERAALTELKKEQGLHIRNMEELERRNARLDAQLADLRKSAAKLSIIKPT